MGFKLFHSLNFPSDGFEQRSLKDNKGPELGKACACCPNIARRSDVVFLDTYHLHTEDKVTNMCGQTSINLHPLNRFNNL